NHAKPDGAACNDGNLCTQTDTCQGGVCQGNDPVLCIASDQCHLVGECNPSTGLCTNPTASLGTPCDDDDPCTIADVCTAGVCAGTPVSCGPGQHCLNGNCVCDGSSCAGCCDGNTCVVANAQNNSRCGTGTQGAPCGVCTVTQECSPQGACV